MDISDKETELVKYKKLVLATLDYCEKTGWIKGDYLNQLRSQTQENFAKSRLTKLKQWFRDLSEPFIEQPDFEFNDFIKEKSGYDINVFEDFFTRVEKIVLKGKITTNNQFYDIKNTIDLLIHSKPADADKIALLNKLLADYENKKQRSVKKTV